MPEWEVVKGQLDGMTELLLNAYFPVSYHPAIMLPAGSDRIGHGEVAEESDGETGWRFGH
jgi:hypothetical protein